MSYPLTFGDVKNEIASAVNSDHRASILMDMLLNGARYKEAHSYAIRVGMVTGEVLKKYQPGRLDEWDLENLIPGTLGLNHRMILVACTEAQKNVNALAHIGLKPQLPDFSGNRAYGLVAAVKARGEIGPAFYDQVTNFDQSIVDDSIRKNAGFQSGTGLHPRIIRTAEAHCCKWCNDLAGTYDYSKVMDSGNPVWQRHENCRCLIDYSLTKRERVNKVW